MVKTKKYNSLKLRLGSWKLKSSLKKIKRGAQVCSLANAKTVGVSFVATNQADLGAVNKILKKLTERNIQTFVIGYIPVKKPDDFYLSQKGFNFFSDADLDFTLIPKGESVIEFMDTTFDILIDFGSNGFFPMNYMLSMSKAKFKVGMMGEGTPFDMMMDIDKKSDKEYFFDQVLVYLEKIK